MSDDPLKPLLDAVGIDEAHVGPAEMNTLAKRITAASEAFILFPTLAPGLADDQQRPPDYFEIHDREWWIDARGPAGREYLTTLITAAAISDAFGLDHTLTWLAAVLPTMVTVTDARVDEHGTHLTLRRQHAPALPAELADEIHPQDFADLAEALANVAGEVPLPAGGTLTFIDD